jgi:hypothetical protein
MLLIPKKMMNVGRSQLCGKSRKGQWDQPEYRDGEPTKDHFYSPLEILQEALYG